MDKINNIIFDYDGTLHNSIIIYAKAFRQAYKYLVKKSYVEERLWTDKEISKWIGLNPKSMWNEFMPDLSKKEKKICSKMIGTYMIQYIYDNKAKLYKNSIEVLEFLNQRKFNLIMLSNCKVEYMKAHRRSFHLDNYFKAFYCSEEFDYMPKYEIFDKVKAEFDGGFLIVGDRYQDMEIAKIHDLPSVACNYGFGKKEELKNASFSINNIVGLKQIIDKII